MKSVHAGCLLVAVLLMPAASGAMAQPMSRQDAYRRAAELSDIGRVAFVDPGLSVSGTLACATCHDPANHFSPSNARPVQMGGPDGQRQGFRAAPSLTYLNGQPGFTLHFHESDDEADESIDAGPTGGLDWDGRVDRARDQAQMPLLDSNEMANPDINSLSRRLATRPYAARLAGLFGGAVFASPARAVAALGQALEAYEQEPEFHPYSSKYDAVLRGQAGLTEQEARGRAVFEDPARGNCARCHVSEPARDGTPPQFTDNGLVAVGVPRNPEIPANADAGFFDLGLCGPMRQDLRAHPELCGLFATPSLRNVAARQSFFHNGAMHDLTRAVAFYATRDTDPGAWYPTRDGSVRKFDDLPATARANVENDPPFGGKPGDKPSVSDAEIADIVAFLGTLTDGWSPPGQASQ